MYEGRGGALTKTNSTGKDSKSKGDSFQFGHIDKSHSLKIKYKRL